MGLLLMVLVMVGAGGVDVVFGGSIGEGEFWWCVLVVGMLGVGVVSVLGRGVGGRGQVGVGLLAGVLLVVVGGWVLVVGGGGGGDV